MALTESQAKSKFTISHTFDAPRDLMWRAYTEAEHLRHWWGPKGFRVMHMELDLRPGGSLHYGLESPQGQVMWGLMKYVEVDPQDKLSIVLSFSNPEGTIARHPMAEGWPLEMYNETTFEEHDGKTTVTLVSWPINATPEEEATFAAGHDSMRGGYGGTFAQLAQYLAEVQEP